MGLVETPTGIITTAIRPENAVPAPTDPTLEAHRPPITTDQSGANAVSENIDPSIKPFDPAEFDHNLQAVSKESVNHTTENKESTTLENIFQMYDEKLKKAKQEAEEINDFFNHSGKSKAESNGLIPPTQMPDFRTLAKALIDANFAEINETMDKVPVLATKIGDSVENHKAELIPQIDEALKRAEDQVASIPVNPTLTPTPDQASAADNLQNQLNALPDYSAPQAASPLAPAPQPAGPARTNF